MNHRKVFNCLNCGSNNISVNFRTSNFYVLEEKETGRNEFEWKVKNENFKFDQENENLDFFCNDCFEYFILEWMLKKWE